VKRFWREASVVDREDGFVIALDDRLVRTPGKRTLVVPTRALGDALAGEWGAQGDTVEPSGMLLTRLANSALDSVVVRRAEVVEDVVRYGATDLVCYRAADPPELIERQSAGWRPLVDWIASDYGIGLEIVSGVVPAKQSRATIASFHAVVSAFDDFPLTGLHAATTAGGSLVIALALARGRLDAEAAWSASQLDESYQIERWGEDAEASDRRARLLADIAAASRFMTLAGAGE
jgi:chaperone required for assembly of F1-ATPase